MKTGAMMTGSDICACGNSKQEGASTCPECHNKDRVRVDNDRTITELREVCPLCGQEKSKGADFCRSCRKSMADETAASFANAIRSVLEAKIAHRKTRGDDGKGREALLGPVFTWLKVGKGAVAKQYPDGTVYLYDTKSAPIGSGHVSVNIFWASLDKDGKIVFKSKDEIAALIGKTVKVILEVSHKVVADNKKETGGVPYVTAWVVDGDDVQEPSTIFAMARRKEELSSSMPNVLAKGKLKKHGEDEQAFGAYFGFKEEA